MPSIAAGLFEHLIDAQDATQALLYSGFAPTNIVLLAVDNDSDVQLEEHTLAVGQVPGTGVASTDETRQPTQRRVPTLEARRLWLPDVGTVLLAGAPAIGMPDDDRIEMDMSLDELLLECSVPGHVAALYAEGLQRGNALLVVAAEGPATAQAGTIFQRCGAVAVDQHMEGAAPGGDLERDLADDAQRPAAQAAWEESSKVGTASGVMTGATSGALLGSVGGPAGAVVGGLIGAATGGAVGAAGDVIGETNVLPAGAYVSPANDYQHNETESYDIDDVLARERDFQQHYEENYHSSEIAYNQFLTAYRQGFALGRDPQYHDRDWLVLEEEFRAQWEEAHPDHPWFRFRNALLYGWERARHAVQAHQRVEQALEEDSHEARTRTRL